MEDSCECRLVFIMKKLIIIFTFISLNITLFSKNSNDEFIWNYGLVDNDKLISHKFEIHNTGKEDVNILSVKTGCPCMSYQLSTNRIASGLSTEVLCKLDLTGLRGKVEKTFHVLTDDPERSDIALTMTGEAHGRVFFTPASVSFGSLKRAYSAKTQTVQLDGYQTNACISSLKAPENAVFTVKVSENKRSLDVTLPEGIPSGAYQETWEVATTDEKVPTLPLRIFAVRDDKVTITPTVLEFQPGTERVYKMVLIRPEAGAPDFEVTSAELVPPFGKVEVLKRPRGSWHVRARCVPNNLPHDMRLIIQTTLPGKEEVVVPITVKQFKN